MRNRLIFIPVAIVAAATAAGSASTPLTWKKTTPYAELSLKLSAEVRHAPVLNDRLYRGEIKALERFAASAADPKDGLTSESPPFRAQGRWEMQVTYSPDVETPRLISLVRESFEDAHGAHPNHTLGGVVFDKISNRNPHPLDLLRPGADIGPLDRALCAAARAAKRQKLDHWNEAEDSNFACPTWNGVLGRNGKMLEGTSPPQITLVNSDTPGRAAGLDFLYSPYDLGAYAEGSYEVVLPTSVFRAALRPEYAGEFAGRPRPVRHGDD